VAVRFLLDEQISPRVATILSRMGVDARAVAGSRLAGLADESVFRKAVEERRVLVTYDIADFVAIFKDLLKEGLEIPGLVLVDPRTLPTSAVRKLAGALVKLARKVQAGQADLSCGLFLSAR
jgi:predicted nuclease of predicted toxin-antitoxin system